MAGILLLTACTTDEDRDKDLSFIGSNIDVDINLGDQQTRAGIENGSSAYLTTDHVVMREYYLNSQGELTSPTPLVWTTSETTPIYGYYVDGGKQVPAADRSYTVTPATQSYLAGMNAVKFPGEVELTLRQQLAKIQISIKVADGSSTVKDGKLGGGKLYTSGTFSSIFNAKGYGIGGDGYVEGSTEGTGWTVAVRNNPVTLDLDAPTYDSGTSTYTFTAIIMPQIISDTSTPFLSVTVADIFSASYTLKTAVTFRAGYKYTMEVDEVTKTLYITNSIEVQDFTDYNASRIAITPETETTWS